MGEPHRPRNATVCTEYSVLYTTPVTRLWIAINTYEIRSSVFLSLFVLFPSIRYNLEVDREGRSIDVSDNWAVQSSS